MLLDGRVLADAEPSLITAPRVPDRWPKGPGPGEELAIKDGIIRLVHQLDIPGRGAARLDLTASTQPVGVSRWPAHLGIAVIAATALVGLLLVYRHARSRLRTLGEIRESLLAMHHGEQSMAAVQLRGHLGKEADAWNRLLLENQKVKQQQVADRARQSFGTDRHSSGGIAAACDVMSQGLLLVDRKGKIIYANGAAGNFLNLTGKQLAGSPINDLIDHEEIQELMLATTSGANKRRGSIEIDLRSPVDGGTGVLRFSVRPVPGNHTAGALVLIEDITQQRAAEDARHAFVAQATHELRTPLTNIRLSAENAIDAGNEDGTVKAQCLNIINEEAHRLERIVADMLSVAEIEAGAIALSHDDVPLENIFERLRADYQSQADEKKIDLKFELPKKYPKIEGDRDKILLALHNLLGNALKYTPEGKQVVVTVDEEDKQLAIHVSDTGIGIDHEYLASIFEKFYRAKDKRVNKITGSGLGLALAREVIRLHGGDITVESQLNQGSSFTLTLPVSAQAA